MTKSASDDREEPDRYDVLRYSDGTYRSVPAGAGEEIIAVHESEVWKRRWIVSVAAGVVVFIIVVVGGSWALGETLIPAGLGSVIGIATGVARYWHLDDSDQIPELTVSDAPTRVVQKYTDEFDSDKTTNSMKKTRTH
jgi:hypothetical protein